MCKQYDTWAEQAGGAERGGRGEITAFATEGFDGSQGQPTLGTFVAFVTDFSVNVMGRFLERQGCTCRGESSSDSTPRQGSFKSQRRLSLNVARVVSLKQRLYFVSA